MATHKKMNVNGMIVQSAQCTCTCHSLDRSGFIMIVASRGIISHLWGFFIISIAKHFFPLPPKKVVARPDQPIATSSCYVYMCILHAALQIDDCFMYVLTLHGPLD